MTFKTSKSKRSHPNYGQESHEGAVAEQIHDLIGASQFHKKDKAKQRQGHTTKKQTKRRPAKESETAKWTRQIKAEEARRRNAFEKERLSRIHEEFNREDWEKEIRAEEETKQWEQEIREEELRRPEPRLVSEAIRGNTSKWVVDGDGYKDPVLFLDHTTPAVERLVNATDSVGKKVNTVLVCKMVRSDPKTGENTYTITHFRSKTHSIISDEDTNTEYNTEELSANHYVFIHEVLW